VLSCERDATCICCWGASAPAARRRQLSIDVSCLQGAQQQTRRPPLLLSMNGTDRRTDVRPLHRPCSAYYAGSVNKWKLKSAFKQFLVHIIRACSQYFLLTDAFRNRLLHLHSFLSQLPKAQTGPARKKLQVQKEYCCCVWVLMQSSTNLLHVLNCCYLVTKSVRLIFSKGWQDQHVTFVMYCICV